MDVKPVKRLKTESKPTLQSLPHLCLREIVSNLSIPECLELRTLCPQLTAAVNHHFLFVNTLPVILSAPSSRSHELEFEAYFREIEYDKYYQFGSVQFGPAAIPRRCLTVFDDKRMLHEQAQHFQREDFVVVPNTPSNLNDFLEFIRKYMPNITKLAVIIDYANCLEDIQRILNLYGKQLKVLLLDKTAGSDWKLPLRRPDDSLCSIRLKRIFGTGTFRVTNRFFNFMKSLEKLQTLYFFPKKLSRFDICGKIGEKFINTMLLKMKVFHVNSAAFSGLYHHRQYDFGTMVNYETLKEMLCCWNFKAYEYNSNTNFHFRVLQKVICEKFEPRDLNPENMPELKTLHLNNKFIVEKDNMNFLYEFSKLEHLRCYSLISPETFMEEYLPEEDHYPINDILVNYSVKHLVIDNQSDGLPVETILEEIDQSLPFFAALETITILKPFMKHTVEREEL